MQSPTRTKMIELNFVERTNFLVTRKRSIEDYMSIQKLNVLVPGANLSFSDWDDVKKICAHHPRAGDLGGKKVASKYFRQMDIVDLRSKYNETAGGDEFLEIYEIIKSKI